MLRRQLLSERALLERQLDLLDWITDRDSFSLAASWLVRNYDGKNPGPPPNLVTVLNAYYYPLRAGLPRVALPRGVSTETNISA